MAGTTVPSFASFRPKAPAEPPQDRDRDRDRDHDSKTNREPDQDSARERDMDRRRGADRDNRRERHQRHGSRERDRHGHRRHRDERYDRRRNSPPPPLRHPHSGRHAPLLSDHMRNSRHALPPQSTSADFVVDTKGDPANIHYLSLYKPARFYRYGSNRVLGLDVESKIDTFLSTDKETVIMSSRSRWNQERRMAIKPDPKEDRQFVQYIKVRVDPAVESQSDYITLPKTGKRKRGANSADWRFRDDTDETGEDEVVDEDQSDGEQDDASAAITQRTAALTRKTNEDPTDADAWLDLIDHQEAVLSMGNSSLQPYGSDRRTLAEVRIPIYEQALKKATTSESQSELQAGLMTEALHCWSTEKLSKKWNSVIVGFPDSYRLRIQYLDFVQANFDGFTYETCHAAFLGALAAFQQTPQAWLHVMLRLTNMMKQAGYQELALGIWQALLEFRVLSPDFTSMPDKFDSFEEFWESEVARVGEDGAQGWRNFDPELSEQPPQPEPSSIFDRHNHKGPLTRFALREAECIEKLRFPGRAHTDIDPYHLVMFSDVEKYIRLLPAGVSSVGLIESFVLFMGLPPFPGLRSWEQQYHLQDPFLQHAEIKLPDVRTNGNVHGSSFSDVLSQFTALPVNGFQLTAALLATRAFTNRHLDSVDAEFIRRLLAQLAPQVADEAISEYLIAFSAQHFPSELRKIAKPLLKARPSSLRLYNAYAFAEQVCSNDEGAEKVFRAALSMEEISSSNKVDRVQLFHDWVWSAVRNGKQRSDVLALVLTPDWGSAQNQNDAATSPASILRARTAFSTAQATAVATSDYTMAVLATSLLALLSYTSSTLGDFAIDDALKIHQTLNSGLASMSDVSLTSPVLELHAQSMAALLAYHASQAVNLYSGWLRKELMPLLEAFPDNMVLLALHSANESRFPVTQRLQHDVASQLRKVNVRRREPSIVSWHFTLWSEMQRLARGASTWDAVRRIFKTVVEGSQNGRVCASLWTSRVRFELASLALAEAKYEDAQHLSKRVRRDKKYAGSDKNSMVERSMQQVHDVFFGGLTRLPWHKRYMMLAFTEPSLRELLSDDELRRVARIMQEKEMRLYVEID